MNDAEKITECIYEHDTKQVEKNEFSNKTLKELFERLEKEIKVKEDEELNYEVVGSIQKVICNRIGTLSIDALRNFIEEVVQDVLDEVENSTAKLRNHRHNLEQKFSSKPEF